MSERDFGIFVSAGGFNKKARDFAFSKRHLKLIDGDELVELVELVYKYYPHLDAKYKGMIPLAAGLHPRDPDRVTGKQLPRGCLRYRLPFATNPSGFAS